MMASTHDMDYDEQEGSSHYLAALKFPDDFAEFQARADSGGSTYGMLKRHAFAQQSLRVVTPSDPELNVVVPQRRANSLVPPVISSPDAEAGADAVPDQKMIIAALCEQAPHQQKRHRYHHHHHPHSDQEIDDTDRHYHRRIGDQHHHRHHHHHHHHQSNHQHRQQSEHAVVKMDTLQIPMDFHGVRRHTTHGQADDAAAAWPLRRQSLQPKGSSPTGVVDSCAEQEVLDASLGCRRRSFSVTPKGDIVNEGDEILPLQGLQSAHGPTSRSSSGVDEDVDAVAASDEEVYRVLVLGGPGVGKTAITQQFHTSEYMAAQNTSFDDGQEIKVPVLFNGAESVMEFIDLPYSGEADLWREFSVDGYIVVYSITDRRSFQKACDVIVSIRQQARRPNKSLNKPLLLVANKSDLERARVVAKEEGKSLAKTYGSKYMEVSAILNHKVDDLLVSALKQIRLCRGSGRSRRAAAATGDALLSPGDGGRTTDNDDCSSNSSTTTATRSRSPGLFSRLIRAASPRRT